MECKTKGIKPFNYDKLQPNGFIPENELVEQNDIIIGKSMPSKSNNIISWKDNSMPLKAAEKVYVDINFKNVNSEGYTFAKVRTRAYRIPTIGDKLSSKSGQKGTIGMTYRQEDMPFTEDGIIPDIIVNPHAIPSRMTIGQLMETILGKSCVVRGATFGDATPFNDMSVHDIAQVLEDHGLDKYGNEVMYNSFTGEMMHMKIFIGPTYYQRLKHMTIEKIHSRSANGPVVLLTRQPSEGKISCIGFCPSQNYIFWLVIIFY
jgi:DNA-directed RNA polymerase II subunit RPB2